MSSLEPGQRDDVRNGCRVVLDGGDAGHQPHHPRPESSPPRTTACERTDGARWVLPHYTTQSLTYRVEREEYLWSRHMSFGEDIPAASPCLGPNCLALYLGCTAVERRDTVWFEPCIKDPDQAVFEYDADNRYWNLQLRLIRLLLQAGRGRYLVTFPDLIEGLDTSLRCRLEQLLTDDRSSQWVFESLGRILICTSSTTTLSMNSSKTRLAARTSGHGRQGRWPSSSATSLP